MWYEVPQEKPKPEAPPKAIFPWERQGDRPRPTRKFAEDQPPEPPKPKEKPKPVGLHMPPAISVGDDVFTPFSPQANAWDANPSIERYVRAVFESQNPNRARAAAAAGAQTQEVLSPTAGTRRESLILTDFPTADDRPSLPVTPAPIRRPTFWGEERNEAGELPAAEGVPDQAEWVCPQCGFSSDSPAAFLDARSASSALEHGGDGGGVVAQGSQAGTVEEVVISPTSTAPVPPPVAGAKLPKPPRPAPSPPAHAHASSRNAWDDIPLPVHLRPRPKMRHSSSDFSSASTAVGPSTSVTAGPDDLPKLGSDVRPPVVEPSRAGVDSAERAVAERKDSAQAGEDIAAAPSLEADPAESPLLGSNDSTPTQAPPPAEPSIKQTLPPPAWLTGPITQQQQG
jgi:hypothetical protein